MKKSVLLLMSIMLVSFTGCDFLRAVAGRPSSGDIEEKRLSIMKAEEKALQHRIDSMKLAEEQIVVDSLATLESLEASGVTISSSDRIGGFSGMELEYKYYIIVGAFRESANARKLFNVASEKGYFPVLLNCRGGMVAVGLAPTDRIAAVRESYERLKAESFCPKEAWILVNE